MYIYCQNFKEAIMKNHRKSRVILSYFIIFCLILIQFTPMAAIVQAEELGENDQTDVQTNVVEQNSTNQPAPSPGDPSQINNGANPPSDEENATNNEATTSDKNNTIGTEPAPAATQVTEENFKFVPTPFDYRNLTRFKRKRPL